MAVPFAEKASGLDTATENESRFFRKRIVYGEKGVRPIAVYVGTHVSPTALRNTFWSRGMIHIEPSKLFRAVKERIEFDDKERKHLDKCDGCREVLAVFENYIAEAAAEESRGA